MNNVLSCTIILFKNNISKELCQQIYIKKKDVIIHQNVKAREENIEKKAHFWHSAAIPGENVLRKGRTPLRSGKMRSASHPRR